MRSPVQSRSSAPPRQNCLGWYQYLEIIIARIGSADNNTFKIAYAGIAKWSNALDCKSNGLRLRRFESYSQHQPKLLIQLAVLAGELNSKKARKSEARLAPRRGRRIPKHRDIGDRVLLPAPLADIAQLVEQHFCKVKVVGSNPSIGSI